MWWEIELKMERGKGERGGKVGFMVQLAPRVVIYTCNKPSWGTSQSGVATLHYEQKLTWKIGREYRECESESNPVGSWNYYHYNVKYNPNDNCEHSTLAKVTSTFQFCIRERRRCISLKGLSF